MALAFGIAARAPPRALKQTFKTLLARLSARAGFALDPYYADSYEELTARFAEGRVTIAWLPPLPFVALERAGVAMPLVGHSRGGSACYEAVLIVRGDSKIRSLADLHGARV